MQRYAMTIRVRPEHEAAYRKAHQEVPADVLRTLEACHVRNYSIFLRNSVLFGYFEYVGNDYAKDMEAMAADPATQAWWERMKPMQEPYEDRAPGDWWAAMEEVFHLD